MRATLDLMIRACSAHLVPHDHAIKAWKCSKLNEYSASSQKSA